MSQKYAIIDLETTGIGRPGDRIIEIAIFIHDGQAIIDKFTSLINPECPIPFQISHLTGITDDMVDDAPKFFEIARNVVEMTEGAVFVAHNVSFDYNFICREFKLLEYTYKRETLCTVKLSRKLIPGLPSYGLGNLCKSLDITIEDRHRAAGDALATVRLFEKLLDIEQNIQDIFIRNINNQLRKTAIDRLPRATGVYYFYDESGDLIYVGKSKNIYERVISHFNNQTTKRAIEMRNKITDIHFELTGSELIALLLESDEIKKHKPVYNRAQRRSGFPYGIFTFEDKGGYINFCIKRTSSKGQLLNCYSSKAEAQKNLFRYTEDLDLCQKLCGLYASGSSCFQYTINQCQGACIGEEHPMIYNKRASKLVNMLSYVRNNMLIIDKGREDNEKSIVYIEKGKYLGFGYLGSDIQTNDPELIKDCIHSYDDNRDVKVIIKSYLRNNKVEKIVNF